MRHFAALRRIDRSIAGSLAVLGLAWSAQLLGVADPVDARLHDALLRFAPFLPPTPTAIVPDVAVVTIDPRSLRAL